MKQRNEGGLSHDDLLEIGIEVAELRRNADELDSRSGRRIFENLGLTAVAMCRAGVNPAHVLELIQEVSDMSGSGQVAATAMAAALSEIEDETHPVGRLVIAKGPSGVN